DNPIAFTGNIFGFTGTDPQHSDVIDLKGIAFDAGTSWMYQDNAGSNTGGTLTISETVNGTSTTVDSITFANGDYTTANFKLTTDGSGGTLVTDPPAISDMTTSTDSPSTTISTDSSSKNTWTDSSSTIGLDVDQTAKDLT